MLNETETLNGFANRFLWACVRRSKLVPFPEPMDPGKLYLIQEKLMETIIANKAIGRMVLSSRAEHWWLQVYDNNSKDRPGMIGSVMNRAEAQVIRLSMLYAPLDSSKEIKARHIEAALSLWSYCKGSVKFIFADKSEDPTADRILNALKDGPKSKTELHGIFKRHKSAKEISRALRELISQNKINKKRWQPKGLQKPYLSKSIDRLQALLTSIRWYPDPNPDTIKPANRYRLSVTSLISRSPKRNRDLFFQ